MIIDFPSLIEAYGLPAVFLGSIFEGETVVVLAAYAARQDLINGMFGLDPFVALFVVAMFGSFLGDQIYFWLGRYWGKPFLAKRPALDKQTHRLQGMVARYETAIMFGSRFMYGFRIALPVALGLGKARGAKYAVLNLMGSFVWAGIWSSLGWYAFDAITKLFAHTKKFEKTIVIGVILGVIVAQGIGYMRRRIAAKIEEVEEEIEKEEGGVARG